MNKTKQQTKKDLKQTLEALKLHLEDAIENELFLIEDELDVWRKISEREFFNEAYYEFFDSKEIEQSISKEGMKE